MSQPQHYVEHDVMTRMEQAPRDVQLALLLVMSSGCDDGAYVLTGASRELLTVLMPALKDAVELGLASSAQHLNESVIVRIN
jgi:hypothetical protein